MRQFLEDAEKESEKGTGTCEPELNVKDTKAEAEDMEDLKASNNEAIRALRMLFEDFEDRVQYQNEVQEESASEAEETPQETVCPFCEHSSI